MLADINTFFPPIGFYLAFTLVFTYFLSKNKEQVTSAGKSVNTYSMSWLELIAALVILMVSSSVIIFYGFSIIPMACSSSVINSLATLGCSVINLYGRPLISLLLVAHTVVFFILHIAGMLLLGNVFKNKVKYSLKNL